MREDVGASGVGVSMVARSAGLVAGVRELCREAGRRRAEIDSSYAEAVSSAESSRDSAVRTAESKCAARLERIEQQRKERLDSIKADSDAYLSKITSKHEEERLAISRVREKAVGKAKRTHQESLFLVEAVFDVEEPKPGRRLREVTKELERLEGRLDAAQTSLEVEAAKLRKSAVLADGGAASGEAGADATVESAAAAVTRAEEAESAVGAAFLPGLVRRGVLWFVPPALLVAGAAAVGLLLGWDRVREMVFAGVGGGLLGVVVIVPLFVAAKRAHARLEPSFWSAKGEAERAIAAAREAETARAESEREAAVRKRQGDIAKLDAERDAVIREADGVAKEKLAAVAAEHEAKMSAHRQTLDAHVSEVAEQFEAQTAKIRARRDEVVKEAQEACAAALAQAERTRDEDAEALRSAWSARARELGAGLDAAESAGRAAFAAWDAEVWSGWMPDAGVLSGLEVRGARVADLVVDPGSMEGGLPDDAAIAEPLSRTYRLPLVADVPGMGSLTLRVGPGARERSIGVLREAVLRVLTTIPPGKARLTFVDPVGLGQSFAGFMHLGDYLDSLVSNRIWTEERHIEQRLTDLTEHMEVVIQKYLRNEFDSIEAYNEQAGEIAEPYRFLVVADFPVGFNEAATRRLASILESGARCGVHTIIACDESERIPGTLAMSDLERSAVVVDVGADGLSVPGEDFAGVEVEQTGAMDDDGVSRLMHAVGSSATDASRVEVPFAAISPSAEEFWSLDSSETLKIPLGRAGATRLQHLELGRGTSQHVLIAGKTGSGKSTLLHVMIASAAMWYAPDQLEFYLVDFKKGVEFKTYASLKTPHARVVAVESDREFGLSVLKKLDQELKVRGDLFRANGVQSLGAFRKAQPGTAMPRILLVIDEFQEVFTEDDKVAQDAALLLDRLVRQGRAFGMHVMLGSQTLSGAYSLARSTMGQMAIRIALQCSETDSYLILSEDNAAARLLARPGEAIYNDANGMIEGNHPFQVCWLGDEERDSALAKVRDHAVERGELPAQIVFEGNTPARLEDNAALVEMEPVSGAVSASGASYSVFVGEPVAIKGPTAAVLRRSGGSNVAIVGQREDLAAGLMACALVSLDRQLPGEAEVVFLDATPPDDPLAASMSGVMGELSRAVLVGGPRDADGAIARLHAECMRRESGDLAGETAGEPTRVLFINGVHRFRSLRKGEDDFGFSSDPDEAAKPDKQLAELLRLGPPVGIHVVVWCDSVTNLSRSFDRQAIAEFDQRVLFQMSANDSMALVDSPDASRLGMHRGLFVNQELGVMEKFRPYEMPSVAWLARLGDGLVEGSG